MVEIINDMMEFYSSLPSDLQGLLVIIAFPLTLYGIGRFTEEDADDGVDYLVQGWKVMKSMGGSMLVAIASGMTAALTGGIQKLSQFVEVEEPLIKIGPLLEIKGGEISVLRILAIIFAGVAGGGGVVFLL